MFAVDVCNLPETGSSTFVLAAGLLLLVVGVIVTRWVRQSAGRLSVVVAPLSALMTSMPSPVVSAPSCDVVKVASRSPLIDCNCKVVSAATCVLASPASVGFTTMCLNSKLSTPVTSPSLPIAPCSISPIIDSVPMGRSISAAMLPLPGVPARVSSGSAPANQGTGVAGQAVAAFRAALVGRKADEPRRQGGGAPAASISLETPL